MATAKSIPPRPQRAVRAPAPSFERAYLIRRGLITPAPANAVKVARLLQGGAS